MEIRGRVWAASVAVSTLVLTGCADALSTREAAVDYNRAFADARNEVLLLNILRTWAREPMQFSTVAGVTGGVRTGAEVTLPFTNVLVGGEDSISPSFKFGARNPNVSINPLGAKEFMQGMAKPASVDLIDSLVTQGWHRPTVLALTVGGVTCPADKTKKLPQVVKMNLGEDAKEDNVFTNVFSKSEAFSADLEDPAEVTTLRMSGKEAAEFLTRGAGEGRKISAVEKAPGSETDYLVKVTGSSQANVSGLDFRPVCGDAYATDGATGVGVVPRSPQGMIFYLAHLQGRGFAKELATCNQPTEKVDDATPVLFRIRVKCNGRPAPVDAAVATEFQGRYYYIPRAGDAGGGDRTLQTLSLLAEFIALQTTEAAVAANRPILTVSQ
jgi:hypothetical protein